MKKINFIKTVPPKQKVSLHRWFWFTVSLSFTLIISLTIYSMHHLKIVQNLKEKCNKLAPNTQKLQTCLAKKRELKTEEKHLKSYLIKSTRIKEKPKNPAGILNLLTQTLNPNTSLVAINSKKKRLDITILSKSTEDLLLYLENLKQNTLFTQIDLQIIEPTQDQIKAIVQATLP